MNNNQIPPDSSCCESLRKNANPSRFLTSCEEIRELETELRDAHAEALQQLNETGGLYEEEQVIRTEETLNEFDALCRACQPQIDCETHALERDLFDLGMDRYLAVLVCRNCDFVQF